MQIHKVESDSKGRTQLTVLLTERTELGDTEKVVEVLSGKQADLQDVINKPSVIQVHAVYRGRKLAFTEKRKLSFR